MLFILRTFELYNSYEKCKKNLLCKIPQVFTIAKYAKWFVGQISNRFLNNSRETDQILHSWNWKVDFAYLVFYIFISLFKIECIKSCYGVFFARGDMGLGESRFSAVYSLIKSRTYIFRGKWTGEYNPPPLCIKFTPYHYT